MRTAAVIGTGLIGTSAALALTARGVTVHLRDHDPDAARTAAALGAGIVEPPRGPGGPGVVAVPPAHVAATARRRAAGRAGPRLPGRRQRQGPARAATWRHWAAT